MARAREPLQPRILRSIDRVGECWIWKASKFKDGYGAITVGRKGYRAHRVSYEAFNGPIPDGFHVCHRCDVPLCVNPDHLFLGTPRDNTQDMIRKGRAVRLRDAAHPLTKVSHADRDVIRARRKNGETLNDLAKAFSISFQTVSSICTRVRNYGTR